MEKVRVAVIAGTPVDTKMGVDFLLSKGLLGAGYPVSSTPEEQSALQILSPMKLEEEVRNILRRIKRLGIGAAMVYCNSMSAAVDMERLAAEEKINIITPFTAYRKIAAQYSLVGLMAANNQSAAGIEKVLQNANPKCDVFGLGALPLVVEIEKGTAPEKIIEKFSLKSIMEFFNANKVEAIILGCTHFPYFHEELGKLTDILIIDPAEIMYESILDVL
ncbi:MAG: glutamate racemase [Firmicutes bacterium]|nr:glutamate racemase [Bacillota bacterium]